MLLQMVFLELHVRLILVRVRHGRETKLDHLLAAGSDGEVEAVPLLKDLLCLESQLNVREPSSCVVCPEWRQGDVHSVSHHM